MRRPSGPDLPSGATGILAVRMRYLLRRAAAVLSGIACALLLSACLADTEDATQITPTEATLHAVVDWESGDDLPYWFELRERPIGDWFRAPVHDPGVQGTSGDGIPITERVVASNRRPDTSFASAVT